MYLLQEFCRLTVIFYVLRVQWIFSTCCLVMKFTERMRGGKLT